MPGFTVLRTADLTVKASETEKVANTTVEDLSRWSEVVCRAPPTLVTLSADDLTLAVCVTEQGLSFAHMYDVRAFADKVQTTLTDNLL